MNSVEMEDSIRAEDVALAKLNDMLDRDSVKVGGC
jgi:hypothetical protein